jgi:hypothetical protein
MDSQAILTPTEAAVPCVASSKQKESGLDRMKPLPTPTEMNVDSHVLAIIYSSSQLDKIKTMLNSYDRNGKPGHDGVYQGNAVRTIRIDYHRDKTDGGFTKYVETNRCIVTIPRSIYNEIHATYGDKTQFDFRISEYEIRPGNHPPVGCAYALYIPIPKEMDLNVGDNFNIISKQMNQKLMACTDVGFLRGQWHFDERLQEYVCVNSNFKVYYPSGKRESGTSQYSNEIVITFDSSVSRDDCVRVKTMLDITVWTSAEKDENGNNYTYFCHVAWCRRATLSRLQGKGRAK